MPDYVVIGKVAGRKGDRGAIKVKPLTDNYDRFRFLKKVYIDAPGGKIVSLDVDDVRKHHNMYILTLKDSSTQQDNTIGNGSLLKVPMDDVPPLTGETYYYFQIEGLRVKTKEGCFLGVVEEIIRTGGNDVFVVRGQKEHLIPFIDDVVEEIDLQSKCIIITPLKGLLDEV